MPPSRRKDITHDAIEKYEPVQTESTIFDISPPLEIEYNVATSKCFDLIMLDEAAAAEYLEEDEDNVIILNKPESVAICFTRQGIQMIVDDASSRFIECTGPLINKVGDRGQRWIGMNPPVYVRVPVNPDTGTNAFYSH